MKRILLLLLVGFIASPVFSQKTKVKIKDKIAYINDEAFLKWEDGSYALRQPSQVTHVSGESPMFVIQIHMYGSTPHINLRFLDFDGELWTSSMTRKKLYSKLYKADVFNDDGTVDEEKAKRFIRSYHEEPPTRFMIGQ